MEKTRLSRQAKKCFINRFSEAGSDLEQLEWWEQEFYKNISLALEYLIIERGGYGVKFPMAKAKLKNGKDVKLCRCLSQNIVCRFEMVHFQYEVKLKTKTIYKSIELTKFPPNELLRLAKRISRNHEGINHNELMCEMVGIDYDKWRNNP